MKATRSRSCLAGVSGRGIWPKLHRCGSTVRAPHAMAWGQSQRFGRVPQQLQPSCGSPDQAEAGRGAVGPNPGLSLGNFTMIVLPAMLIGAVWGAVTALKRGGRRLDAAQYGAVYAIGLGLLGVLISVVLDRMIH